MLRFGASSEVRSSAGCCMAGTAVEHVRESKTYPFAPLPGDRGR